MAKRINRAQLLEMFKDFKKHVAWSGVTFAGITYFCDHSQSKTVKGKKVLQKLTQGRITIGSNYEDKVNRLKVKQGEKADFVAEKQKGKFYPFKDTHPDAPIVESEKNPGFLMLCLIFEHTANPDSVWFHEGKIISREDAIAKQLLTPAYFQPKPLAGRGEVEEENNFFYRTLGLDKIVALNIAGEEYKIEE